LQARIVVLMARMAGARKGEFIARTAQHSSALYVLLNGRAEVRTETGRVLQSLGRGDIAGEMGLVRQRPRSADIVAVEDTEFLILDEAFLRRLPRRYPRIASKVLLNLSRILSDRLENTTRELTRAEQPAVARLQQVGP
jgi:CRP-like cAMP-binding protein